MVDVSNSRNMTIIIGNVANAVVMTSFLKKGKSRNVVNLRIATNHTTINEKGNIEPKAEFHRVSCYDYLAEQIIKSGIQKGTKITVIGAIQYENTEKTINNVIHVYRGCNIIANTVIKLSE